MDRVPELYRRIIDDVLIKLKGELERYGWDEETVGMKLTKLQQKWEQKINENGCLDPTNTPLIRGGLNELTHPPTKSEKRKAEKANEREMKKQARLNKGGASVHDSAAAAASSSTTNDASDELDTSKFKSRPLSYPVLNPRAASEQHQRLTAQFNQQIPTPLAAITVASQQRPPQPTIPPAAIDPDNPFEPDQSQKRIRPRHTEPVTATALPPLEQQSQQPPLPTPPAALNPFALLQIQAQLVQQVQLQQQHLLQQQQQQAQQQQASGTDGHQQDEEEEMKEGTHTNDQTITSGANRDSTQPTAAAAAAADSSATAASSTAIAQSSLNDSSAAAAASSTASSLPDAEPLDPVASDLIAGRLPPSLTSSELGPNDDDSDDDAAAAVESEDLILCQFEKVAHLKDRWKVVLKDGIIRVNKRDFVFSKASGEFDW